MEFRYEQYENLSGPQTDIQLCAKKDGIKDGTGRGCWPITEPTSFHTKCSTGVLILFAWGELREIIELVSESRTLSMTWLLEVLTLVGNEIGIEKTLKLANSFFYKFSGTIIIYWFSPYIFKKSVRALSNCRFNILQPSNSLVSFMNFFS